MNVSLGDIVFMDPNPIVSTVDVNELFADFKAGKIEPIPIFYYEEGKFYARGGDRDTAYMLRNRAREKTVPIEFPYEFSLERSKLANLDLYRLENNQLIGVRDLRERGVSPYTIIVSVP